jgi:hypothetical protein
MLIATLVIFLLGVTVGLLYKQSPMSGVLSPESKHTTETVKTLSLRPDSVIAQVTTHPDHISLRAKPNSAYQKYANDSVRETPDTGLRTSDSLVCFDSVGYFSVSDSLPVSPDTVFPDTISVCHNLATNEFSLLLALAPRREHVLVKYMARDSLITIHDSVTQIIKPEQGWWHDPVLVVGGVTVGAVLGVLISLITHL